MCGLQVVHADQVPRPQIQNLGKRMSPVTRIGKVAGKQAFICIQVPTVATRPTESNRSHGWLWYKAPHRGSQYNSKQDAE